MKNLIIVIVICVTFGLTTSCENMFGDFLEKAPGVDITIDTLFSSKTQLETFVSSVYEQGMFLGDGMPVRVYVGGTAYSVHNNPNFAHFSNSCDEGKNPTGWYPSNSWNSGSINVGSFDPTNWTNEEIPYIPRWNAVRISYILIQNVDRVPDIDQTYKDQIKAEAKFFIAANYFTMFKRYGGLPILYKAFDVTKDNMKIQRSSVDSTVQFIVKNLDDAAAVLPDAWPSNWKGRITKGAALALKAKTLLYAASPLFNTTTPYLSMSDPSNNKLICYGNYDVNRWKLAADAAKAVLDWAPAGGVQLITDKGVDKNYKHAWEVLDNSEIILAEKETDRNDKTSYGSMPWAMIAPNGIYSSWGGVNCTHTFVENFYDNRFTGKPMVWYNSGTDLNEKYDSMDYRFKQTVAYNGSYFSVNKPFIELFTGGLHTSLCLSGYWMRKFVPEAYNGSTASVAVNYPHLRLNEQYLIYAEALNEYNATPPQVAYDMVNAIRSRSGMPNIPNGLTQAQFRDRVQKEWGTEFAFENHRFWDIRRWMIAEQQGVMQGSMYRLTITKGAALPALDPHKFQFSYVRSVFDNRTWNRFEYLFAFNSQQINLGYLVQNPGY